MSDSTTTDFTAFYNEVFGGQIGAIKGGNPFLASGSPMTNNPSVSSSVITPSGQAVTSSGNKSTDFLNSILGTSPLSGDFYKDPATGATVTPQATGGVNDAPLVDALFGAVGRIAIIILGFIFVAVGLSMFKGPSTVIASGIKAAGV